MDRSEIEQLVVAIVRDQKTLPPDPIDVDKPLAELGFDSLDALNMMFAVEDNIGVVIPDYDARAIRTVRGMIDAVEGLLQSRA